MADKYGAITLPIQPPPAGSPPYQPAPQQSVSDPLLDITLAYLQAVINAKAAAAWAVVMPGVVPVKTTVTNDPEETEFNERDLPCLYAWRAASAKDGPERLAEDIIEINDAVHLFWVFPPARQAFQAFRGQMVAGISKIVHAAIESGRDPSWVYPGDTDPQAARYGSNFPRIAGWSRMMFDRWESKAIVLSNDAPPPKRAYPALHALLTVTEILDEDLTKYDAIDGVDQTETTEDGQVVTDHALFQ